MDHENLLAYPDLNKEFKIHTDARDFQVGAVIRHNRKAMAFQGRKLTGSQKRYTVTKQKMLSIVENLKYFRTILIGKG